MGDSRAVIYAALLALGSAALASAQDSAGPWCGTEPSPQHVLNELLRATDPVVGGFPEGVASKPWFCPLALHIVRFDNGTGGVAEQDVLDDLALANELYAQVGVVFLQHGGFDYINSTALYDLGSQAEGDTLRLVNIVPDAINVYYVRSYVTTDGSLCGQSTFTDSFPSGVIIDQDCIWNGGVLAHELGHYFDLYHTHETAFGIECPSGANCFLAGDLLCDTPADPNLDDRVTDCVYNGGVTDACDGVGGYSPDPDNIMSYTDVECMTEFTTLQTSRVFDRWDEYRGELFDRTEYVDAVGGFLDTGLPYDPHDNVTDAVNETSTGDYVIIKPGSYFENLTITRAMKLHNWTGSGSVVIGD